MENHYILKVLTIIFIINLISAFELHGQVSGISYFLKYHPNKNILNCNLVVNEGATITDVQRIQFNTQISFITPTGIDISINQNFMPLQNNKDFEGSVPLEWMILAKIEAPSCQPHNNFISIAPTLAPIAYYNNIKGGDTIKLFDIATNGDDIRNIRLYENLIDPSSQSQGMKGGDFSQAFAVGGLKNLYQNNIYNYDFIDKDLSFVLDNEKEICIGEPFVLEANKMGVWQSDDENIAIITQDNIAIGIEEGTVSFTFLGDEGYYAKTPFYKILNENSSACITNTNTIPIEEMTVYPNPANQELIITGINDLNEVEIYSMEGQKFLVSRVQNNDQIVLGIRDLLPGLYIVRFGQQLNSHKRFVKVK